MIDTLDVAGLEQFQLELIQAGFEPADAEQRSWVGPIAPSLAPLTSAKTMRIVFFDGWPFQHPRLYVDGIDEQHVTSGGDVCLWATGAPPEGWLTLADYLGRIDGWVAHAKTSFRPEDFALDAHLYFDDVLPGTIATVNLSSLRLTRTKGGRGEIAGTWKSDERVLEIKRGRQGDVEGRWYFIGSINVPPRSLEAVRELLDGGQRANFDRRYQAVAAGKPRLFLVVWERELGREALVLLATNTNGVISAQSVEVAPTDTVYLKNRAGPDAKALAINSTVVFGAGAIGSHVARLISGAGLGRLRVVDGDRLRPSNVVRHAASSVFAGYRKADVVDLLVRGIAPWTRVTVVHESPWGPSRLHELIGDADLVIDTTGHASFALLASHVCREAGTPLVSAALYRGGFVGRIRRQATDGDVPIVERGEHTGHPLIPPGDEPVAYEPGCSSAVNNASPIAVAATAATAADIAVDALTGRFAHPDEVIDVYRSLGEVPFDKLGRVA